MEPAGKGGVAMDQGPLPVSFWTVPRFWVGRTVAVMASGSSMSLAVADQVRAARLPSVVVNSTWQLAPWADLLYAADEEWWKQNPDAMEFAGIKVSVASVEGVMRLKSTGMKGFDPDQRNVRLGGNSSYQAVHIAMHTGAKRILLCGVDMGGKHWHPEHAAPLRSTPDWAYQRWITLFGGLAKAATEHGIEIWNCSPISALKCFEFVRLESALAIVNEE